MNEIATLGESSALAPVGPDTRLSESTRRRIRESVPESTRRAYSGDWNRFAEWCVDHDWMPLPANGQILAEYANHLANEGKAPSTIDRALSAISTAHDAAGFDKPNLKAARQALVTYRRERADAKRGVRKAAPMTIDVLRALVGTLDLTTLAGQRDRALLVLGFALGARRSELAALDMADLADAEHGIDVAIRRSKTDRHSAGRAVAIVYGSNPDTCPVRVTKAWLERLAAHGRTAGPLFLRIDRHGYLGRAPHGRGSADGRLTGQAVAIVVRRAALAAGLDPSAAWSGHSLRRGFATATYAAGADALRIARHGGWKDGSATLLGYVEEVERVKNNPLIGVGL